EWVVVVDDGSTDGTAETARAGGAKVLCMPRNVGKARAVTEGMRYVRRLEPTAVVMLDGDGQHDPRQIPTVLGPVEAGTADMVIGSRFIGVQSRIPRWRVVGQRTLTLATNAVSGVRCTDSQSGFRAFGPRALPFLEFRASGFSMESEMQFIARENDLRLAEAPIAVIYTEPPKRNPVAHGLQVLSGVIRLAGQARPLLFFGVPGFVFLLSGLLFGIQVILIFQASRQLAVGYALACVLLSIFGLIGVATGVMLHAIRALLVEWLERRRVLDGEERSVQLV
ncbi:MAG: glycosyltransferase family 2 protein, partial [Chloroflexota bacterium]|nr:glycosyltransferase family 2 protein [Chloroflexota bacterium]